MKSLTLCCADWLDAIWYKKHPAGILLMPLSLVFGGMVWLRKSLYRLGVLPSERLPVPVIIVGNISVGGTGKTPLLIWLAAMLTATGHKPGIISRGYGGQAQSWPQTVTPDSDAKTVGDEALLLAKQTACPTVVGPKRVAAAKQLLKESGCTVILSDDGLQHYALHRDLEIAVIDGERRFGNGYCLPQGPLREPVNRLQTVDFIVINGDQNGLEGYQMRVSGDTAINLATAESRPLSQFANETCHAFAGIGNPERFFNMLKAAGLNCQTHSFPDHHPFQATDIQFNDKQAVLMTEKDAVKCAAFADRRHWFVPVSAEFEAGFAEKVLAQLNCLA